jgi:hypothetical protein
MTPRDYRNGRPTRTLSPLAETGFGYARDGAAMKHRADWVFFQCMDEEARRGFDLFLLETEHPSIYQAGTVEQRFRNFCREYAEEWVK